MPAAAVIPAPLVYIKVVAVKKLVVDFRHRRSAVRAQSLRTVPFDLLTLFSLRPGVFN